MEQLTEAVIAVASSPWIYPIVFLLTVGDAFLVIVPSETVVVALGALAIAGGEPSLWLLVPVAALAAMVGDSLCFAVGRGVGLTRYGWMRRPGIVRAFSWAAKALDRRAAAVLLTARFIPYARIAVNLTAGATGFRYRRFLVLTAIAGLCWALYNTVIGALVGAWLGANPLIAVAVSVVIAIALGLLVDRLTSVIARRRAARATTRGDVHRAETTGS